MFCNNSNDDYDDGDGCYPLITGNKFIDNNGKDHGGGIALEDPGTQPVISNNLFVGNHVAGAGGGGIQALESKPTIVNNTFVGNSADLDPVYLVGGNGGAILVRFSDNPLIINNIFFKNKAWDWSNSSSTSGNSVACREFGTATLLYCRAFSDVTGSDTLAYHYSGATIGEGCGVQLILVTDTALFVDEGSGDFHLRLPGPSYTPMDKGHDLGISSYDKVPTVDLEGYARPVDISGVTNGSGGSTDMGAYERQQ